MEEASEIHPTPKEDNASIDSDDDYGPPHYSYVLNKLFPKDVDEPKDVPTKPPDGEIPVQKRLTSKNCVQGKIPVVSDLAPEEDDIILLHDPPTPGKRLPTEIIYIAPPKKIIPIEKRVAKKRSKVKVEAVEPPGGEIPVVSDLAPEEEFQYVEEEAAKPTKKKKRKEIPVLKPQDYVEWKEIPIQPLEEESPFLKSEILKNLTEPKEKLFTPVKPRKYVITI